MKYRICFVLVFVLLMLVFVVPSRKAYTPAPGFIHSPPMNKHPYRYMDSLLIEVNPDRSLKRLPDGERIKGNRSYQMIFEILFDGLSLRNEWTFTPEQCKQYEGHYLAGRPECFFLYDFLDS